MGSRINMIRVTSIKSAYKKLNLNIFVILTLFFLPLMFISDGVSKYLTIQGNDFSRISLLVRLLFEVSIITYLLFYIKKTKLIYLFALMVLLAFFVIGQFLIENQDNFVENFISFNKYIFLFLSYLFFQRLFSLKENQYDLIYFMLKALFFTNIVFIFSGLVFDLNFFESFYNKDYRYGYNGVFLAGNESSFVLINMLGFLYFRAYYENGSKLFLLTALLASLLSGMKAVYLFVILLLFFHLVQKMRKIHLVWLIPISIYATIQAIEYIQSEEFQTLIALFIKTAEEKGFLYMLMSGRQEILANEFLIVLEKWTFLNFFIGGSMIEKYIIEMDLFDLILFFGALGSLIYIYLFYKMFIQKLIGYNFFTFFIFSILILAFFGGHFLASPANAIYFSLVIIYFQNYRSQQYAKNSTN